MSLGADPVSFGERERRAEAAATEAGRGEKPGKPKEGEGRDEEEGGQAETEEEKEGEEEGGEEEGGGGGEKGGRGGGGGEGEETGKDPRLTASPLEILHLSLSGLVTYI